MKCDFTDSVVLVTGACGQLGRALCFAYLEAGATVIGTDKEIRQNACIQGERVRYHTMDITDKKTVATVFKMVAAEEERLDILINNAGVSCFEPFEERPEESVDWVMNVNLKGTLFCIQAYANLVDTRRLDGGSIVNIASMYGMISPDPRIYTDCPRKNAEIYGATKAGIIQMTKYFAVHLADRNIRVNAVSPGGVVNPENPQGQDFQKHYADRCPMGRMAKQEELTGGVLFLSHPISSYTTGANLVIDGGMSCW